MKSWITDYHFPSLFQTHLNFVCRDKMNDVIHGAFIWGVCEAFGNNLRRELSVLHEVVYLWTLEPLLIERSF